MSLEDRITKHESLKLKPYMDCCKKTWRECRCPADKQGALTIGVGLNVDDGISAEEAFYLRDSRIKRARNEAATFRWFESIDSIRQGVVVEMLFNLGLTRFCEFRKMIEALGRKDYDRAASEMLSSKWAGQVKERATTLAALMRSDVSETP